MSQAYEALVERVRRLDEWISETERVAATATDADTRHQIESDLARWRGSRADCAAFLARIKWLNRAASATLVILVLSFGALFLLAFFSSPKASIFSVLIAVDYLILFASTVAYLAVIMLRDSVARGGEPWRFSLRSALIVMTVIALMLGSLTWIVRR